MYFGLRAGRGCYPSRTAQCGFPWLAVHSGGVQQPCIKLIVVPLLRQAWKCLQCTAKHQESRFASTRVRVSKWAKPFVFRARHAVPFLGGHCFPQALWLIFGWPCNTFLIDTGMGQKFKSFRNTTKSNFAVWDILEPLKQGVLSPLFWPTHLRLSGVAPPSNCCSSEAGLVPQPGAWLRLSYELVQLSDKEHIRSALMYKLCN